MNKVFFFIKLKYFVSLCVALCLFATNNFCQSTQLPTKYYTYNNNLDKAIFLKKAIGDSVNAAAFKQVPTLSYIALELSKGNDTLTAMFYQLLADNYDNTHKNDSAAYYYKLSLLAYKKIPIAKKLYLQQSLLYSYNALNIKDSVLHYIQALSTTIKPMADTVREKLQITNTIASCYTEMNRYEDAIVNFSFVIQHALKIKDSAILRNALVNIGNAYSQTSNNTMAIYYTLQSLPYFTKENFDKMLTYTNLTDAYLGIGSIDSAKIFFVKAEAILNKNEDPYIRNVLALRQANILMTEKKYNDAERILQKSLLFLQQQEPSVDLVNCLLIYATLDTLQNKYAKAKEHLLTLYSVASKMNQRAYIAEDLRLLASVHEHLGDYKTAYNYQKMFIAVNDSIKTEKAQESFAELQTQYETYKKEEQIKLLQQEARIKDLELSAAYRNKSLIIIIALVLLAAIAIAWYIRNLRSSTALQQQKVELEMKALRSQMNPHFIFNSLNSIQKYIWENKREDASEYLTKFARLIRSVLDNSLHTTITLASELEALKLYIEMEHRRNNQQFDYSITVADNIDTEQVNIPPLLLQPFVENAIWHGLSQKENGRGKLTITIDKNEQYLLCKIDDDGIGRTKAAAIKAASALYKTSLANNISAERIEWIQKDTKLKATVEIIDNYVDENATGTTVLLTLPINNK